MCNSDELDFTIEEKVISGVFLNNKKNGMIIYTEDTQMRKLSIKKFTNNYCQNHRLL